MIGSVLVLIVCSILAIALMGVIWGTMVIVSIMLFMYGLLFEATGAAMFGIVLFFTWFIGMSARGVRTPKGRQETKNRTKQQIKEEEEWGITDFSDKK